MANGSLFSSLYKLGRYLGLISIILLNISTIKGSLNIFILLDIENKRSFVNKKRITELRKQNVDASSIKLSITALRIDLGPKGDTRQKVSTLFKSNNRSNVFRRGEARKGTAKDAPQPTDFPKLHLALFHKSSKKIILKGEGGPGARLMVFMNFLNKHQLR